MNVKIVPLKSDIAPRNSEADFVNKIREKLKPCNFSENGDIALFAVATGGTESKFKNIYGQFKPPYILVFNEYNNSLPAATEILAFLRNREFEAEVTDLNGLSCNFLKKRFPLAGKTLGAVGEPSDWLIASTYSDETFETAFRVKVKHIDMKEAFDAFRSADKREAEDLAKEFVGGASTLKGVNLSDVKKAFGFYLALKEIIKRHRLDFISVRCFDVVRAINTTGCVALSKLNSEGITASCEGDLPSAVSMEIARIVSGSPGFMANVSYLREAKGRIRVNFAHCTVATKITEKYNLRTHFETGKGVGVEGKFSAGSAVVFRIGGKSLREAFVAKGKITETKFSLKRCRTQINVEFAPSMRDYFLKRPLGNHHIIVKGNYGKVLEKLLKDARINIVH